MPFRTDTSPVWLKTESELSKLLAPSKYWKYLSQKIFFKCANKLNKGWVCINASLLLY